MQLIAIARRASRLLPLLKSRIFSLFKSSSFWQSALRQREREREREREKKRERERESEISHLVMVYFWGLKKISKLLCYTWAN